MTNQSLAKPFDELSNGQALDTLAALIDQALDDRDTALTDLALDWCGKMDGRTLTPVEAVVLDYYRANAWANRYQEKITNRKEVWAWDLEELQQQIYFLRRALYAEAFKELDTGRQCQILTNLANQLDTVGRFIEARALWGRALAVAPRFWMARANRGSGLRHYGRALYDGGHAAVFALTAHTELTEALTDLDRHPEYGDARLRLHFQAQADGIAAHYDLPAISHDYDPDKCLDGVADEAAGYRQWCLGEVLFLNPLNDLSPAQIAANDILTLPSFSTGIGEAPFLAGFYNQLKQEFVSARWLHFEGATATEMHFSDRDVLLYDTLDAPVFGLAVEKMKISFRMSYSLFDKIAYFLNRYLQLGIPENKVNFRQIWREGDKKPIRQALLDSENWPFRGLYWLSKDLFEKGFMEVAEPDARALNELRNHLEHKYVKVHHTALSLSRDPAMPFFDPFSHSITCEEMERRSLQILRLARSALVYLSLGMHQEERRRCVASPAGALVSGMPLAPVSDDHKRRF